MEPNKLENQIREKLNAREITPSAPSWDRLDAMLSVAENKKPKSSFNWIYIAACIVGFVFVGLVFFNQNNTNEIIKNHQVVESNSNDINSEKEKLTEEVVLKSNPYINQKTTIKNTNIASVSSAKKEVIKVQNASAKIQPFVKSEIIKEESIAEVVPQKIEEKQLVAENQSALLASNEINKSEKTTRNKSRLKVNPNALLSQVDGEVKQTFRRKAFRKITENFESTREAFVARNQESTPINN